MQQTVHCTVTNRISLRILTLYLNHGHPVIICTANFFPAISVQIDKKIHRRVRPGILLKKQRSYDTRITTNSPRSARFFPPAKMYSKQRPISVAKTRGRLPRAGTSHYGIVKTQFRSFRVRYSPVPPRTRHSFSSPAAARNDVSPGRKERGERVDFCATAIPMGAGEGGTLIKSAGW